MKKNIFNPYYVDQFKNYLIDCKLKLCSFMSEVLVKVSSGTKFSYSKLFM
jgi:hypothetical protein